MVIWIIANVLYLFNGIGFLIKTYSGKFDLFTLDMNAEKRDPS
jgi:hypothetical protein